MKNEQEIFERARALPSREAREGFLRRACGPDRDLRRGVEELLEAYDNAGEIAFLQTGDRSDHAPAAPGNTRSCEGPGTLIGRYKLLQRIGEGGCGVVYMAEQEEPVRRKVALKIVKLGMDTKSVIARFEAERQALALMDHPNIAKVLDGGATDAGRPYFVMELVRGIRITEYCDEVRLSTRERLDLFIKVCQAIQSAHQKGIIHRDIKPSNILVTINDGVAVPKVIDFGIAKATEGRLTDKTLFTQFAALIGTPAYMSPEQTVMTSLDIDTRSDIYSLGVLLYELLAGSTPFDGKELMASGIDAMRRTIREQEPMRPSTRFETLQGDELTTAAKRRSADTSKLLHQLKGDLDWIVMKCLEKERARRYETANGLVADLKRHLNHEPVLACPPSAAYKLQKAFRRNRFAFTAGTAIAVALVLGVVGTTIGLLRAERQSHIARRRQAEAEAERSRAETEQQRADAQARKASENQQHSRRLLYAADMNLAQQSLNQDNLGRTRRLLDRHRPQPGEEDLRGWEWRYLWQLTRSSALVTLTNRPLTRGWSVSISPDGSRLAVGWYDGRVELWDIPGQQLVRVLTDRAIQHRGLVAFSPVQNLLVATSEPKTVAIYDLDSGRQSVLWHGPDKGDWRVRDLAFSEDGSKAVIYAADSQVEDAVWVVNVSSSRIENYQPTDSGFSEIQGGARLAPDNRRLYFPRRHSIQCLDLATGETIWQTEPVQDAGLTALAISPDGKILASGSGFEGISISVWDAATGQLVTRLDRHNGFVCNLTFTKDGRRLISSASDQTIRFWDTSNWAVTKVLRGHTEEVRAVAISATAKLLASAGKDGNLMLWKDDQRSAPDGYRRLPRNRPHNGIVTMDGSRVLLLPPDEPSELVDLKRDAPPIPFPELGFSSNVLGGFGTNVLCQWNGTNQILVRELHGDQFILRGAVSLDFGTRPTGFAYHPARQLLAWTTEALTTSVYVTSLAAPERRIELRNDVPGPVILRFSENGEFLLALKWRGVLHAWNIETGQIVATIGERVEDAKFAADGTVLVASVHQNPGHEVRFHDLGKPDRAVRRIPGRDFAGGLAVSPDGGLVVASFGGSRGRLFDAVKGELVEGVLFYAAAGLAFSPDGSRLISTKGGRDTGKLWDVGTSQELLTFGGAGSYLYEARWSADGDVILAGPPWQAWRAPSWEEIAATEATEKAGSKRP